MPQIAQQDYIKAVATPGRMPYVDCNVLSVLAKALETGTLFDVLIVYDDSGDICEAKVLTRDGKVVYFFDGFNTQTANAEILYTPSQYAALSAVQLEVDKKKGVLNKIPVLKNDGGYLFESEGYYICNPDGYKYSVTAADGKIASISVSNERGEGDYIVIDEETAQDLIGLPIQ